MKRLHLAIYLLSLSCFSALSQNHPLDPLSWQEYWTVLEVLRAEGHLTDGTGFSMINLREPDKQAVWKWKAGEPFERGAYATVHEGKTAYHAEINLKEKKLDIWRELEDAQPTWLGQEFGSMVDTIKKHPEVIAAMKKRGYDDLQFIDLFVSPPGYYGTEEQKGRRIGHAGFIDVQGVRNSWSRGIEGLVVVVDLREQKILRVVDEGVVPLPEENIDYDPASIGKTREVPGPIHISQPMGKGFSLDGHIVEWQKWRFHIKADHRVGMIISTVTYGEGEDRRPILYKGNLSEIFVPYMDPAFDWYHRNFLDAGEYTQGGLCKPLLKGLDAPDYAHYMNALVCGDDGRPVPVPQIIAIFERESGDPSWRHYSFDMEPESRKKRDLVVRSAAVLGNYDYVFDWIFQQDGSIRVQLGATGIAEAKPAIQKDANDPNRKDDDLYGRFVDPHIVAVNHDHYFSYRIDLDVDGSTNNLVMDRLRQRMLPEEHPRRSVWVRDPMFPKREGDVKVNIDLHKPALWRVLSTSRKNHVGYPTSYQLMPGKTTNTLLSADDFPRRRAGFINHHLWATPYDVSEQFAAGDYPTLSLPDQGLPSWVKANRSIENTDIVLWYTMAMHHMVRAEDWPVMPVLWHSFEIRPFDFFNGNPAMDLPRN
ncbi:MAG: hypothetical protein R8P61_29685 [Bacteroidia bacterium]|nr:hypothetical protein [Bacteroidia bacterium]